MEAGALQTLTPAQSQPDQRPKQQREQRQAAGRRADIRAHRAGRTGLHGGRSARVGGGGRWRSRRLEHLIAACVDVEPIDEFVVPADDASADLQLVNAGRHKIDDAAAGAPPLGVRRRAMGQHPAFSRQPERTTVNRGRRFDEVRVAFIPQRAEVLVADERTLGPQPPVRKRDALFDRVQLGLPGSPSAWSGPRRMG